MNHHPFQLLVQTLSLSSIVAAVRQMPKTTIVKSATSPDIHITTKDLRDLISQGMPIYHELLVLSLETLCKTYDASYLDPSFYPTLITQGPSAIQARFALPGRSTTTRPSLDHHNIALPLHVNGNHWIALNRRIINGTISFYYTDDLNMIDVEHQIRARLQSIPGFFPPGANWINCTNYTYHPHTNECGPRTILTLAISMSHPAPSKTMLQQYMNANLAMQARTWMSHLLLQGYSPLLPHQNEPEIFTTKTARALPFDLLDWSGPVSLSLMDCTMPPTTVILSNKLHTPTAPNPQNSTQPTMALPITKPMSVPTRQQNNSQPDKNIGGVSNSKSKFHKSKVKYAHPPNQLSLHDFQASFPSVIGTPLTPQLDSTWGHQLAQIERDNIFRVILQNPRGLKLGGDSINTLYSLSICHSIKAGVICLPESNTNWGHRQAHSIMHRILRKVWKHSTYSTSYTEETFEDLNQPGGTAQIITNNCTSRVLERGTDPFGLGRWTYAVLRGANNRKVVLITAYRVCSQAISTAGQTTSTAQQFRKLSKRMREVNMMEDLKPRRQFIMDLQAWIESLVA